MCNCALSITIFYVPPGSLTFHRVRHLSQFPPSAQCLATIDEADIPHITIIRPVKGLEPFLYECLAATFRQTYPNRKLTIFFCVASHDDAALPTLRQLVQDFSDFDVEILVEQDDPYLQELEHRGLDFGPNPKIRNTSRAYRQARGDLIWNIDCNVWVGPGVAGRMVDALLGYGNTRKQKLVHQLPVTVDTSEITAASKKDAAGNRLTQLLESKHFNARRRFLNLLAIGGGRLDELFMSSAHAKFYTAINTVSIAPCIVGKSSMFRRSHLNALTEGKGLDYFSFNICEDHLIGDLLWKHDVPNEVRGRAEVECGTGNEVSKRQAWAVWGNHARLPHDPAIQPMEFFPLFEYVARRIRWLRVRKFTVTLATLVEPGTESMLCGLYGAYAFTTLSYFHERWQIPQTWAMFWSFFLVHEVLWACIDWTLYLKMHAGRSIEVDEHTPIFARRVSGAVEDRPKRPFGQWLIAWLGRETLAFPVWFWAVWAGTSVSWRGKRFSVGLDMRVQELDSSRQSTNKTNGAVGTT